MEFIMLMAYKTNRILDHKQEVWSSEEKIKQTVLDEKMCLSLIFELLHEVKKDLWEKYSIILNVFTELLSKINQGFRYEQNYLNINLSSKELVLSNRKYNYQTRNTLLNSVYDYTTLVWYYLWSGNETIFEKYEIFFVDRNKYSHLWQLINDLSDYSSVFDNNVKSYQDAFSDIRNGIITQPTYELMDSDLINDALDNLTIIDDPSRRKNVISLLVKKWVKEKIREVTKEWYNQHINFWQEVMKVDSDFLFHTYSLLLNNKYFHGFG